VSGTTRLNDVRSSGSKATASWSTTRLGRDRSLLTKQAGDRGGVVRMLAPRGHQGESQGCRLNWRAIGRGREDEEDNGRARTVSTYVHLSFLRKIEEEEEVEE
jgi:hypothetical protein